MRPAGWLSVNVPGAVGAADLGGGGYRIDMMGGASRLATAEEVAAATAAVAADQADLTQREADRATLVQLVSALTTSIQAHTGTPDVSGTAAVRLDKLEARTLATEQRITRLERIARHYLKGEMR